MAGFGKSGFSMDGKVPQIFGLVLTVVVVIIVYFALQGSSAIMVQSSRNFTLNPSNSVYFSLPDSKATYSLFLKSSGSSSATVYISTLPVLAAPVASITLSRGQTTNLSMGGSQISDLQVRLIGANSTQGEIELSFIPRILNIRPSSGIAYINPAVGASNSNSTQVTTSTATTTVAAAGATTTVSSTTTAASTILPGGNSQTALTDANLTSYGALINKYKVLVQKDTSCTSAQYNSTYYAQHGSFPRASASYANVSPGAITNIMGAATFISGTNYNVTYTSVSVAFTVPILNMNISTASKTASSTPKFLGAFFGYNYSKVNNTYTFQNGISGNCGAYIAYAGK